MKPSLTRLQVGFVLGIMTGWAGAAVRAAAAEFDAVVVPFLRQHCHECHGGRHTKGDLDLKRIVDDRDILKERKLWRDVLRQLTTGEMPPKKHSSHPSPEEIARFEQALQSAFTLMEARLPADPGHVTVRRLNRTEYNNTVRDLLSVDYNPADTFPADDIGHGFDNIGDVLSLSPVHLERYLDAAEGLADRAVPLKLPKPPTRTTYSVFLEPGNYRSENGTRPVTNAPAELFVRHEIKVAGAYTFRVRTSATNDTDIEPARMAVLVGDRVLTNSVVTNAPGNWLNLEVQLELATGEHRFAARFDNPPEAGQGRMLFVNEFKVIGPADTRTGFLKQVASIAEGREDDVRRRAVVEWFLFRAFRRPPSPDEVARYVEVFQAGSGEAEGKFEGGLHRLVRSALCSPKFLFRVELDDRPEAPAAHPIDEFQLASRLSYFLWSTSPDDELLQLARSNLLSAGIDGQIRRMLADPRAEALVQNFGLQWLQLQRFRSFQPDTTAFPTFDERLRRAMLRETELFLFEIVREDRSILDLVDGDFTYVNRALAKHYGIDDAAFEGRAEGRPGRRRDRDAEFVRVTLKDGRRGGLLTHGSVLTITSNPTRTSPVKRGKWVLEQILGTPPPPAPAGVAELDAQKELTGTLRQRMEQHRVNPTCASCHRQMDSLGFAFENFDAIGRYRAKDGDGDIDASGTLPEGRTFSGPAELRQILKDKRELVARNLVEKLMTYGLGRGLEFYDERAIQKAVRELGEAEYRFSALVKAIVRSDPFRMRRGKDSTPGGGPDK